MLIAISNTPREYSWGSETLIPELEGRVPTGRPEAEVWFGAHPGSPSRTDDGRTLDAVLADTGQAPLPYLLKILAAGKSLSIQAHPSVPQAVAGFAREEAAGIARDADDRTYRDDNHKPEIIVALSERFRALVGLRPLEGTRRLLAGLGDAPGISALRAHLSDDARAGDDDAQTLRTTLAWALSDEARAAVDDVVRVLAEAPPVDGFAEEIEVLRTIARDFPGDPGVVVALLMNLVVLRRGEALFAPAGVLHAYQDGLGVELMAASDNVLRGGLTPKHVDVAELLAVVDANPAPPAIVRPAESDGEAVYDVGVPDFRLGRVAVSAGEPTELAVEGPTILLVTAGEVEATGSDTVRIPTGRAAFVSADERRVVLRGAGEVFVARPGRSS